MKLTATFVSLLSVIPAIVSGALIPNADTPVFYLVATAPESAGVTFKPLRLTGGLNGFSTLTDSGPIGKFYFYQGALVAEDPESKTSTNLFHPFVNAVEGAGNTCTTYGELGFSQSSNTNSNICAKSGNFQLSSDKMDAQLGAKLSLDFVGEFFTCNGGENVYYKKILTDGPTGCTPVQLYTFPVVE